MCPIPLDSEFIGSAAVRHCQRCRGSLRKALNSRMKRSVLKRKTRWGDDSLELPWPTGVPCRIEPRFPVAKTRWKCRQITRQPLTVAALVNGKGTQRICRGCISTTSSVTAYLRRSARRNGTLERFRKRQRWPNRGTATAFDIPGIASAWHCACPARSAASFRMTNMLTEATSNMGWWTRTSRRVRGVHHKVLVAISMFPRLVIAERS